MMLENWSEAWDTQKFEINPNLLFRNSIPNSWVLHNGIYNSENSGMRPVFFVFLFKKKPLWRSRLLKQHTAWKIQDSTMQYWKRPFWSTQDPTQFFFFFFFFFPQFWKYHKFWRKSRLSSRKFNQTMVKTKTFSKNFQSGHLFDSQKGRWKW